MQRRTEVRDQRQPGDWDGPDIDEITVSALLSGYARRDFSCAEIVEAYLGRIDSDWAKTINAVVATAPSAIEQARDLDAGYCNAGRLVGPLHGVPILVKDCIETSDMPTTFGSVAVGEYVARCDANVISRLRGAGAIILGKTTLPDLSGSLSSLSSRTEFTRNPYALDRDAGGSSSGSGAAVAANLAAVGIGSDCGGSIRVPAAFSSLVGVRTTPGLVELAGSMSVIKSQTTIGPMARTVGDAALVLDTIAQPMSRAVAAEFAHGHSAFAGCLDARSLAGRRVGVLPGVRAAPDDIDDVGALMRSVVTCLESAGAAPIGVEFPELESFLEVTALYKSSWRHDIDEFFAARSELAHLSLRSIIENGQCHPSYVPELSEAAAGPILPDWDREWLKSQRARHAFRQRLVELLKAERLACLVYPTVAGRAPLLTEAGIDEELPINTRIASQAGLPAVTVPAGSARDGSPLGIEILAPPFRDQALLGMAYALEQVMHGRRVPLKGHTLATRDSDVAHEQSQNPLSR
jgi:amidase